MKKNMGMSVLAAVVIGISFFSTTVTAEPRLFGGPRQNQIAQGVSIKMKGETTSPYLTETRSKTRPRILLNGIWEISNAKKLPYLYPFKNGRFTQDPFPDPPINETPPKGGWEEVLIPSSAGFLDNSWKAYKRGLDWYRKSFTVPGKWRGKRVILRFNALFYEPVLYINGKYVAWTRIDITPWEVDITDFVNFGKKNILHLRLRYAFRLCGRPWHNAFIAATMIKCVGVLSDVFLIGRPAISTQNVFIKPDYRKKQLKVDYEFRNDTKKRQTVRIKSFVTDLSGKKVLDFPSRKKILKPGEVLKTSNRQAWKNPHLWSAADPYLYLLETRIYSKDKKLIDTQKERFGFREIWIENGEFRINGRIVQFNQMSDYRSTYPPVGDRRIIAARFKRTKAYGYNMIRYFGKVYSVYLEVADEVGIYLKVQSGSHHPIIPMNPSFKKDALLQVPRWIRRDRNHPSVVMWSSENEAFTSLTKTRKLIFNLIRQNDPTRPIDTEGGFNSRIYDENNKVRTGKIIDWMEIINPHYPGLMSRVSSLLSLAEMPVIWSKTKPKPLFFGEWGDCYAPGRIARPAQQFKDLFKIRYLWRWAESTLPGYVDYVEAVWPYWSRLGVGGQEQFARGVFIGTSITPYRGDYPTTEKRKFIPVIWDNVNSLGTKIKYYNYFIEEGINAGFFPDLPAFNMSKTHKRFSTIFRPLYAFFLDRTYAVYGKSSFSRKLCLLNRSYDLTPKKITGTARLIVGNKEIDSTRFSAVVPQGGFKEVTVTLAVPQVSARTEARVEVVLDMPEKSWGYRSQKLAVFPELPPGPKAQVLLYDPIGKTGPALARIGIKTKLTDLKGSIPSGVDVLVIGRHSLDGAVTAASKKILNFVKKGGRVVCLAQKADNRVRWIPLALSRQRGLYVPQVVSLTDKKGLFAGIKPDDLSFWPNDRGSSDRVVGCVARAPYKKPRSGRVRSLLECGEKFDCSALLELYCGKGVFLLSQLEMVPVAGISPVADILLQRLISMPAATLPTRRVWYAGDRNGLNYLKNSMGIEDITELSQSYNRRAWGPNDLIIWMPYGKPGIPSEIGKIVAGALSRGASFLGFVPERTTLPPITDPPVYGEAMKYRNQYFVLQVKKPSGFRGPNGRFIKMALPDRQNALVTGLSDAEFFRSSRRNGIGKLANYEILDKNGWNPLARPAVIAWRKQGRSIQMVLTLVRDGKGKISAPYKRILHTLVTNMGGVSRDPKVMMMADLTRESTFSSVDLRPYCNMGFSDEKEGDRKGGFSDQGERSLRTLPTGKQTFDGIPFDIIKPEKNNGKSCLELGFKGILGWLPKKITGINIGGKKVRYIHFLHTTSYARKGELGYYLIRYMQATEQTRRVTITTGVNILDWSSNVEPSQASIAWKGVSGIGSAVTVYSYRWKNPLPDIPIESIDFVGESKSSLGLIAITLEE